MIVKSVDSISCGKISGFLHAIIGTLAIIPFALFMLVAGVAVNNNGQGGVQAIGAGLALILVIVVPIFYGILGFVGGIIFALFYNFAASFVGGLEIETDARYASE